MRVSLALVLVTATSLPFYSAQGASLFANRKTGIIAGGTALITLIFSIDCYLRARRIEKKQFPTAQEKKDRKKLKAIAAFFGTASAASVLTAIGSTIAYLRRLKSPRLHLMVSKGPNGSVLLTPITSTSLSDQSPHPSPPPLTATPCSSRQTNLYISPPSVQNSAHWWTVSPQTDAR